MSKFTIAVTIELDDAPAHNTLSRVRMIADRIAYIVREDFGPDNPGSCEDGMRYDGLEGPYVNDVTTEPGHHLGPLGIALTRDQLEAWAGQALRDEEVEKLDEAIPNSSIPEAIATMLDASFINDREGRALVADIIARKENRQ